MVRDADITLPAKPFLYTLDQVAMILGMDEGTLARGYLYYAGRTSGVRKPGLLVARNINGPDKRPEWRIAEKELIRWMKHRGFRFTEGVRLQRG